MKRTNSSQRASSPRLLVARKKPKRAASPAKQLVCARQPTAEWEWIRSHLLKAGEGVYLTQSSIPNAGFGLFVSEPIKKGEPITAYTGFAIPYKAALQLRQRGEDTHIRTLFSMRWALDGLRNPTTGERFQDPQNELVGQGLAAFSNDGGKEARNNAEFDYVDSGTNCDAFSPDPTTRLLFLRATRPIEPGEEVFVSYGQDYWDAAAKARVSSSSDVKHT